MGRAVTAPRAHDRGSGTPLLGDRVGLLQDRQRHVHDVLRRRHGLHRQRRQKTIDVVPQVFNLVNGSPHWYSIGGAGLFQGPTPISPLRLSADRSAVASHIYRVLVYSEIALTQTAWRPGYTTAHTTVCSSCSGTSPTLSIAWAKGSENSFPPVTASMHGVTCSVITVELTFAAINGTPVMNYGAELICNTSVPGIKRLTVEAQVAGGAMYRTHYTIAGSTLNAGPSSNGYLHLETTRSVYSGHPYRVFATGSVTYQGKTTSVSAHSVTAGP